MVKCYADSGRASDPRPSLGVLTCLDDLREAGMFRGGGCGMAGPMLCGAGARRLDEGVGEGELPNNGPEEVTHVDKRSSPEEL